jgi:hypothetical protein
LLGELAVLLTVIDVHARTQLLPSLVEHGDALLDALEGPHDLALEPDEDRYRVFVGAAADFVRVRFGTGDDPPALFFSSLGQAALVDEECGLLLGARDDPLRLLLGLVDDPLALGVDSLRRADLFGDRDAQLVDQPERGVLVDDDIGREGQLLPVREDRLEALDKKDDVDGGALRSGARFGRIIARGQSELGPALGDGAGRWLAADHRRSARCVCPMVAGKHNDFDVISRPRRPVVPATDCVCLKSHGNRDSGTVASGADPASVEQVGSVRAIQPRRSDSTSRSAASAAGGIIELTSPPN